MDIIRKQRINYTVITTLIAAIFLLVVLGGLFGVVYGSNDVFISKALDKALKDPEHYNNNVANDLRCIFIYKYNDGRKLYIDGKVDVYGDDATEIILKAISTADGKFEYNDCHFVVANRQYTNGTLYALIDRTSYHKQLANTAIMVTLLLLGRVRGVARTVVVGKVTVPRRFRDDETTRPHRQRFARTQNAAYDYRNQSQRNKERTRFHRQGQRKVDNFHIYATGAYARPCEQYART